jgi:ubiquitin-conjugating enzyme E2 J1
METDAKGQLGGLECSVKERERMAEASSAWRCTSCGKSNADIMRECAEAAKEKGHEKEIIVPSDLKMGWKDETGRVITGGRPDREANNEEFKKTLESRERTEEETQLAEGFVRTSGNDGPSDYLAARPAQGVPQPTRAVTAGLQNVTAQRLQPQMARRSNDGVPIWIDRMIAAICVLLAGMVLKVLLGL